MKFRLVTSPASIDADSCIVVVRKW